MPTMWIETALSTHSLRLLANRKFEGAERNKREKRKKGKIMKKKKKKTVRFISGHCI